ncbi:hypothetical protein [Alkalibacillus silvisoli]|uniref:Uncharacterized protein n=1 Tax=Alkalibacillus silvisoli TaxID=392823 RepID=A0ABP3JI58_9BACI
MRYTIYQLIILAGLVVLAFYTEQFNQELVMIRIQTALFYALTLIGYIAVIVGAFCLIMYFQTKKSETFLIHPLWEKMAKFVAIVFALSSIGLIILIEWLELTQLIGEHRVLLYLLIYYFLFLLNVFVLSLIHKINSRELTKERKIMWFGYVTVGSLAVIMFFI